MKKRLRKKRYVGEFRELGFEVIGRLCAGLSAEDFSAFLDRWIDIVEARRLAFGGGGSDGEFGGFVTRAGRGCATDEDRSALKAFLESDPAVLHHEVGQLRDSWYGWD
jgi:uncharacterized protein YggL (DUF469 family)